MHSVPGTTSAHPTRVVDARPSTASPQLQTALFFRELCGEKTPGNLSLLTLPDRKPHLVPASTPEKAAQTAHRLASSGQNIYACMALMPEDLEPGRRGRSEDTVGLLAIGADLDTAQPGKKGPLPASKEAMLPLLALFQLPPSLVLDSGYGLQPVLLLKEPWIFQSDEDRERAARIVRGLQAHIHELARERFGWEFDSTPDLARVYRVPGTFNLKRGGRAPTRLYNFAGPRYSIEELEQFAAYAPASSTRASLPVLTPAQLAARAAPGETLEERIRWTREALDHDPNDERFDDRNHWIGRLYDIRIALGERGEEAALELADKDCRSRHDYDPEETRRALQTLPPCSDPSRGYGALLGRAFARRYSLPEDHPWRAENEFEADPTKLQLVKELRDAPVANDGALTAALARAEYLRILPALDPRHDRVLRAAWAASAALLDDLQRAQVEGIIRTTLAQKFGRESAADMVHSLTCPDDDRHSSYSTVAGRSELRLMDLGAPEERARYRVDRYVPAGAIGEIVARYSLGKTWFLICMMMSVGFGVPFFGQAVAQGPVLFLAYEGLPGLRRRIAGWLVHHGFLPPHFTSARLRAVLDGRVFIAAAPPRTDDPAFERVLTETITRHGIVLFCSDTRNKSLGRDMPEDSADTAGAVNGMYSRIAATTGATHIDTHHSGHTNKDRGRGSSAWADGVDFGYLIEGTAETLAAGGTVLLKPTKMRDDAWPEPISYRLVPVSGLSVDGVEFSSAVVEQVGGADAPSDYDRFLRWVEAHPGSGKVACRKAIGGSREKADELIDRSIDRGDVVNVGTDTHWKLSRATAADDFPTLDQLTGEAA